MWWEYKFAGGGLGALVDALDILFGLVLSITKSMQEELLMQRQKCVHRPLHVPYLIGYCLAVTLRAMSVVIFS